MPLETDHWQDLTDNSHRPMMPSYPVPTIGLALGGGVARGFSHIGVIRALRRYGIKPDVISGTSIGAVVGGCYLAQKLDALEEWALSLSRRKVFSYLDFRVRSPGLIDGKILVDLLRSHIGDIRIEQLPHPFIAIATDLMSGQEVWLRRGDLVETMRASFSLPGVFSPVKIQDRFLVDGALVNPVPVTPCTALGARLTIAVDLNADVMGKARVENEPYNKVMGFDVFQEKGWGDDESGKGGIQNSALMRRVFRRQEHNPSLFGVMFSTLNIVQDRMTRSRLAGEPPEIHIKPMIGHIGLLEFEKAEELIKEGEDSVERILPDIKAAFRAMLPDDKNPFVKK